MPAPSRSFRAGLAALALPFALGGCNFSVLFPAGDVARQEAHLLVVSTILMLLIIIPVMILTVLFAWRYRAGNAAATYKPDWDHSTGLELVIWSAPLAIIIALGAITWLTTHTLDPYRRLDRLAPGQPAASAATKPLEVQVVALDWKWLFIYPEQGIATINELALPTNREVRFHLTASSVMNSFYIPTLAGQVYAMPGMETQLHAVLNHPGKFNGFSANYSGAGFSGMNFGVLGLDQGGFDRWVAAQKTAGAQLDRAAYLKVEKPSENVPVMRFASVAPDLFRRATEMCVAPNTPCMGETMQHDMDMHPAKGAHVTPPVDNTAAEKPGAPKGALQRSPGELGSSPRPAHPPVEGPALPSSHT